VPTEPLLSTEEAKKILGMFDRFVIYTSPLRLNKGIMNVLKALRLLVNQYPNLLVMATGVTDDHTQKEVQYFLEKNDLTNHFRYAGLVPRERLPYYYSASDVVVLVSFEEEGWGITLLEGMMAGKPVIASSMGALIELVQGRGILLEKNTPHDLARAIEQLIQSSELRDQLGQAGLLYARQLSYQRVAQAHLEFFEKLLAVT
jgi:glycosyltransferase involved in cell wall biosynthesis